MLDTVKVKYPINPTEEQLSYWRRSTTTTDLGFEKEKFTYNPIVTNDEVMLKYTYFPIAIDGKPMLLLEFSLPKLVLGNNFTMIHSVDGAVTVANEILKIVPHTPILDLNEGVLTRLDMCYNHQVGDSVDDYIKAIGYLDYPHRRTKYHKYEGAEFRSKHKTTKFYNKELEAGNPDAYGILRQEITIMKSVNIRKLTGLRKPTLRDITLDLVKENLESELEKLHLLNNSITDRDTALKVLCEAHGSYAGIYYYGLIESKMEKSKKRIAEETEMHPRSLDRRLRQIVDTDIPLTLTDRTEPLPPLEIIF